MGSLRAIAAVPHDRRTRRSALRTTGGIAAVVLAIALTGCQSLGDGGATDPGPDPAPDDVSPGSPADADSPMLQLDLSGGFVPIGYDFATVPQLTIYPDGRAITHGPQILIYPGPALPNLQLSRLSDADLDELIDAAQDAGLLEEPVEFGQPPIADAPTMFVTLVVDGQRYEHAVESFGAVEGFGDDTMGLSEGERDARVAMGEFIDRAHELAGLDSEPYVIEAFGLFAVPVSEGATLDGAESAPDAAEPAPGEIEPEVLPWPLDLALTDAAECTVVSGPDAETLLEALAEANQLTRFEQDGVVFDVFFRPLLPHESSCADLG